MTGTAALDDDLPGTDFRTAGTVSQQERQHLDSPTRPNRRNKMANLMFNMNQAFVMFGFSGVSRSCPVLKGSFNVSD